MGNALHPDKKVADEHTRDPEAVIQSGLLEMGPGEDNKNGKGKDGRSHK